MNVTSVLKVAAHSTFHSFLVLIFYVYFGCVWIINSFGLFGLFPSFDGTWISGWIYKIMLWLSQWSSYFWFLACWLAYIGIFNVEEEKHPSFLSTFELKKQRLAYIGIDSFFSCLHHIISRIFTLFVHLSLLVYVISKKEKEKSFGLWNIGIR